MSSRITFRYLEVARKCLMHFTSIDTSRSPQARLTEACLWACRAELNERESSDDPIARDIRRVLHQAVSVRTKGTPLWAGYSEAALHFVERTLGMSATGPRGKQSIHIGPDRARGKSCGTYSTPDFISETMVQELLRYLSRTRQAKFNLLDLSLEAGQFPLSLLMHEPKLPIRFYGIDRDPDAIVMAKRLCRFASGYSKAVSFRLEATTFDSLIDDPPRGWPALYSAVVGNPPWKGGHSDYNEVVRRHFHPTLRGNFDLYLAFILRAHELLQPGGFLSFVIPSTFLFNQNASEVRKLLLDHYDILALHIYPQCSFIEVPSLIPISFLARKHAARRSPSSTLISYHPTLLGGAQRPRHYERVVIAPVWRGSPGCVFHPLIRKESTFLHSVECEYTLKDFGDLSCGARLSGLKALTPHQPFRGIHARDIRPFHSCPRSATRYRKADAVFERPPSAEMIAAPKIVFQDLRYMTHGTRLVAAVAGIGQAPVSTASMYVPKDPAFLHFYAALLNSVFVNGWYKLRDVNRSIKLFHIRELPVASDPELWRQVGAMALGCSKVWEEAHIKCPDGLAAEGRFLSGSPALVSEWKRLRNQIDEQIFELYNVSTSQRTTVRQLVTARAF